jgi:hypothetical protein
MITRGNAYGDAWSVHLFSLRASHREGTNAIRQTDRPHSGHVFQIPPAFGEKTTGQSFRF